jgi:hypothetical protein
VTDVGSHLLSDVVGKQRLLDLGGDNLRVKILRERRHFVDAWRHVLVHVPETLVLPHGRVRYPVRTGVGLLQVVRVLETDGVVGRYSRRREQHRRWLGVLVERRRAELERRRQQTLRLLHLADDAGGVVQHLGGGRHRLAYGGTGAAVAPGAHQLLGGNLVLAGYEFVYRVVVLQEHLHADEGLASLLRQHVPRLGPRQEVAHRPLRQPQHGLAEQPLAYRVLAQLFFHLLHYILGVEVVVLVELLLRYWRQHRLERALAGGVVRLGGRLRYERVRDGSHSLEGTRHRRSGELVAGGHRRGQDRVAQRTRSCGTSRRLGPRFDFWPDQAESTPGVSQSVFVRVFGVLVFTVEEFLVFGQRQVLDAAVGLVLGQSLLLQRQQPQIRHLARVRLVQLDYLPVVGVERHPDLLLGPVHLSPSEQLREEHTTKSLPSLNTPSSYSPREGFSRVPHVLHPPPHQLGQLLLVDPHDFFLWNVIVFVLLESSVLRRVLREGTETLIVRRLRVVVAVTVFGVVRLQLLELAGFAQDVRYSLLRQIVFRTAERWHSCIFA